MRLTTVILIASLMQVSAAGFAQRINISKRNLKLEIVLNEIRKQSGYDFYYDGKIIPKNKSIDVSIADASVDEALQTVLKDFALSFKIDGRSVVIKKKEQPSFLSNIIARFQEIDVRGKVLDETGLALSGASVKVKGTDRGTSTDANGNFYLQNVEEGVTLVISFVGYVNKEVTAKRELGNVVLKLSDSKLDEIQVTAYGQISRRLNTGNQTTVTAKEIQNYPVGNVLSVLQGTVPGMVITQSTGQAGSAYKVVIRGQNGLTTSSDPLYIIDGIPYSGGGYTSQKTTYLGTNQSYDALSFINPLDIESINVLKDADATAIYGSRGANGVIMITTKKGKAGDTKVDVNVYSGINEVTTVPQFLNTQQYLKMRRDGLKNDNRATPGLTDYDINGTWDTTRYTNWPKLFLGGKGYLTNAQASISGGNNNTSYLVSGNYRNTTNVQKLIGGSDQTSSLHLNLNSSSANGRFNISLNGGYTYNDNTIPNADLTSYANLAPNAPALYNLDGTLNFENNTFNNPLLQSKLLAKTAVSNVTSSLTLSYLILKGLKFQVTAGYNKQSMNEFLGTPLASILPLTVITNGVKGSSVFNSGNRSFRSLEPQLNYNTKISRGSLDITAGTSLQKQVYDEMILLANGFNSDLLISNIAAATTITTAASNAYTYKYSAIFGRANYNWENKYLLNISGRYDGSSKFGQDRQFHLFYAAGAAWLFSSEDFIKKSLPFLSFGKLRASYGETGNDQIPPYSYLENFSVSTAYQGIPGLLPSNLPNPYLSWETTRKLNFGLELQFFKGRIGIEGNYFINRTVNSLTGTPLSSTTGFTSITQNSSATVQNKGIDITLNTTNIQGDDFTWSSSLTFSRQRNALLSYPNATPAILLQLNSSVNSILTNRYAGVDPQTGLYQFYDRNGNIVATPASNGSDRVHVINTNPDYFGTMSNTFSYRGFSLNILFRGVKKIGNSPFGQVLASGRGAIPGYAGVNFPVAVMDHWQNPGDIVTFGKYGSTTGPTQSNSAAISSNTDAYYGDASYIRLQNASLSYQIPKQITSKLHLRSLKVYALGQNLATISKYSFIDPETQVYLRMPPLRTITFGLQATF